MPDVAIPQDNPSVCLQSRDLLETFDRVPLDQTEIPQHVLDLEGRSRTNVFPWRGQFSPQLVEALLKHFASHEDVVLDPFAGVGTTLIEAARLGIASVGAELNPSAVTMAETLLFMAAPTEERREVCRQCRILLDRSLDDSFALLSNRCKPDSSSVPPLLRLVEKHSEQPLVRNILANTLIRLLALGRRDDASAFQALEQHCAIVLDLPHSCAPCQVLQTDARRLPLKGGTVDLVITSPPYINVFNYHQNNRAAMEALGWNLLVVARSEFGSNRKHRGNRFLTVVQYALDMAETFTELKRVLRPEGRVIIVIGRESNVRGTSFQNGRLVAAIGGLTGFRLALRQERKFVNKFGELIYEDLLHLVPSVGAATPGRDSACTVARTLLELALPSAGGAVLQDLRAAIEQAESVHASPVFCTEAALRS